MNRVYLPNLPHLHHSASSDRAWRDPTYSASGFNYELEDDILRHAGDNHYIRDRSANLGSPFFDRDPAAAAGAREGLRRDNSRARGRVQGAGVERGRRAGGSGNLGQMGAAGVGHADWRSLRVRRNIIYYHYYYCYYSYYYYYIYIVFFIVLLIVLKIYCYIFVFILYVVFYSIFDPCMTYDLIRRDLLFYITT